MKCYTLTLVDGLSHGRGLKRSASLSYFRSIVAHFILTFLKYHVSSVRKGKPNSLICFSDCHFLFKNPWLVKSTRRTCCSWAWCPSAVALLCAGPPGNSASGTSRCTSCRSRERCHRRTRWGSAGHREAPRWDWPARRRSRRPQSWAPAAASTAWSRLRGREKGTYGRGSRKKLAFVRWNLFETHPPGCSGVSGTLAPSTTGVRSEPPRPYTASAGRCLLRTKHPPAGEWNKKIFWAPLLKFRSTPLIGTCRQYFFLLFWDYFKITDDSMSLVSLLKLAFGEWNWLPEPDLDLTGM